MLGTVVARHRDGVFKVQLNDTNRVVTARPAGRMWQHKIKLAKGDNVLLELPIGTLDRARIVYRRSA